MRKTLLLSIFSIISIAALAQPCGCDVLNCTTRLPNITLFEIYYGDNVTLLPPSKPSSAVVGDYVWGIIENRTNTNNDIENSNWDIISNMGQRSTLTMNPLQFTDGINVSVGVFPSTSFFASRTLVYSNNPSPYCFYGRAYQINYKEVPKPNLITPSDISICIGDSVLLKATSSVGEIQWRDGSAWGNILGYGDSIWIQPNSSKDIYVRSRNGEHKAYMDTINYSRAVPVNIVVSSKPNVNVIASSQSLCKGDSVMLYGTGASTYTYDSGINDSVYFIPDSSKTYYIEGTDVKGCKATSSIDILVNEPIQSVLSASNNSNTLCEGIDSLLVNSKAVNSWSFNGQVIQEETKKYLLPQNNGFYSYIGIDSNGCVSTSNFLSISVAESPDTSLIVNGNLDFCVGDSVTIRASITDNYQWSNSSTSQEIVVSNSGSFSVSLTNASGCSASSRVITTNAYQNPTKPSIQQNGVFLMSSSTQNNQWYYNNNALLNETNQFLNASQAGNYYVQVNNSNGCFSNSDTVQIIITSIESISSNSLLVYPNPSQKNMTVAINNPIDRTGLSIKVFDAHAIEVYNQFVKGKTQTIDVSSWSAGIYFLQVMNGSDIIGFRKIVVNN